MQGHSGKTGVYTNVEDNIFTNPTGYRLNQNYPNPFNPTTQIQFSIPSNDFVVLEIFNALGLKVDELLNQEMIAGNYTINFDATNLSSGIYFYRLSTNYFTEMKKAVLLK